MSLEVMTMGEIDEVSGALYFGNGGDWGYTWTLTGLGATGGAIAGASGGWLGAGLGLVGGALAGFGGSFINAGNAPAFTGGATGSW